MLRHCMLLALLPGAFALAGCSEDAGPEIQNGLILFSENQLAEALPHFQTAIQMDPDNADAHAWMAETLRRLGDPLAAVEEAEKTLELDSCHVVAHCVLANAYNPMYGMWDSADREKAWSHLLHAVTCDSTDGNAWLDLWTEALYRREYTLADRAVRAFIETEILTPGILAFNRWVLEQLPQNALLLTNGDMDTYPAVAVQQVEGVRPDVAIVNYSLLNTPWYARYVRDHYEVPLPYDDAALDELEPFLDEDNEVKPPAWQIMRGWLKMRKAGELQRPMAIASTVSDRNYGYDSRKHFSLAGGYTLWDTVPAPAAFDTVAVRKALASIPLEELKGPLASPSDRSPVRQVTTDRLVVNISQLALQYADIMASAGRTEEALKMLDWVAAFDASTSLGPQFADAIAERRQELTPQTP